MIRYSSSAIFLMAIVLGAVFVYSGSVSNAINFRLNSVEEIVNPLMGLFVAALFMERVQEVIVKAWRQSERIQLESTLEEANAAYKSKQDDNSAASVAQAKLALKNYQNDTKNFAFAIGLSIGFLFALVGLRCLAEIMDYENLVGFQEVLFEFADLIVTAGVIAGGSDAVHKLISIFTDSFDATRKRIKQSVDGT